MNKKTYLVTVMVLLFLVGFAKEFNSVKKEDNNTAIERYYSSSQKEGHIGVFNEKTVDSPTDNVFTVTIDSLPANNEQAWLSYELYGITNHTGISRSINNQFSIGGYFATHSNTWQKQEEPLKKEWLRKGDNIVRFTLPEQASYNYSIRNLKIYIKKTSEQGSAIILNQPISKEYVSNTGYLNGFVTGNESEYASVFIDDAKIPTASSEFEVLIPKQDKKDSWSIKVKAIFPDGEIIEKKVMFNKEIQADFNNRIEHRHLEIAKISYLPDENFNLKMQGASISIEPEALKNPTDISITPLRSIDLPTLDAGLLNVTKKDDGYRFLPHGTRFNNNALVSLEYDIAEIPDGYTEEDIRTYYFDEESKHWVALKKIKLDRENNTVISQTNHFTDVINGVLMVPESPQTLGFIPTSVQNMMFADPSAGINTIEPPVANNTGTAVLEYPIILPAGRQGIQPDLSIKYQSDGENDWLGLGWNLEIPNIGIETRWGVPRYLSDKESETYLLNGKQLWPVAHRGELVSRTSEKQFHQRVEGDFNKIIRHGDSPSDYWWEVTDKSGVRYSFGGASGLGGIVESSVLRDSEGNISNWGLVETRDPNENFIKYEYTKVQDPGIIGGSVPGFNTYIQKITYTGHGNSPGKYQVVFIRDRQLGEEPRKDVTIDAMLGFKKVTADLLRKIDILYNDETIRSYELNYRKGVFFKTLLSKITEFDASGREFTHHEFNYYDDVSTSEGYEPYLDETTWVSGEDDIPGNVGFDKVTMLGGGRSIGGGTGMSVTVGPFDGNLFTKDQTAGSRFGINLSRNDGLLALVDINGDGLDDKVFKSKSNSGLFFRPNESDKEGNISFGDPIQISGISEFNVGWSAGGSQGVEATFGVHVASENTLTTDVINTYFEDVNGDKLVDIIRNGTVYFNHVENGVPTFSTSSSATPSPIHASGNIDPDIVEPATQEEIDKNIDQYPLHDVVKVWEAPYQGIITIDAPVALMEPDTSSTTGTEDGVRVTIQCRGTELWSKTIQSDDFSIYFPEGVSAVTVNPGDRIYFRVQSIEDGTNDQVLWKPIITYSNHSSDLLDADQLPNYQFNAYDDFLMSAPMSTGMPIDGTINIEGSFTKPVTSDNVTMEILKENYGVREVSTLKITKSPIIAGKCKLILNDVEYEIPTSKGTVSEVAANLNIEINKISGYSSTVSGNTITITSNFPRNEIDASFKAYLAIGMEADAVTTVQGVKGTTQVLHHQDFEWSDTTANLSIDVNDILVEKTDKLYFKLIADSKIDWTKIDWNNRLYYTASSDPDNEKVMDDEGNPLLEFYPITEHSIYNKSVSPTGSWNATQKDTVTVTPVLPNSMIIHSDDINRDGSEKDIIFTIKKTNQLVYKEIKSVTFTSSPLDGLDAYLVELPDDFSSVEIPVEENDKLFFDFQLNNAKVANTMNSSMVEVKSLEDSVLAETGIHTIREGNLIFGSMYRGWGQFAYNGNRDRANKPINESELKYDDSWSNGNEVHIEESATPDEMMNNYNNAGGNDPSKTIFIYMSPVVQDKMYMGMDNLTYVQKDIISSSRMGLDDIKPISPLNDESGNGSGGSGAKAIRKVNVTANSSIQGGIQPIVGNLSYGSSNQLYDFMDMNGDNFPDIVSPLRIQYTLPTGELGPKSTVMASPLETVVHGSIGLNGGGELINSNDFSTNKTGAGPASEKDTQINKARKAGNKAAAAGNLGINGNLNIDAVGFAYMDINNDGLPDKVFATGMVALNLGYKFGDLEQWNFLGINGGKTLNLGGGLTVNISYGSIEAGVGLTKGWNAPRFDLQDINGDGLLDWILDEDITLLFDPDDFKILNLDLIPDGFKLEEIINVADNILVRINTGNGFTDPILWKGAKKIRGEETLASSVNAAFTVCIPIFIPPDPVPVAEVCFNPDADASIGFSKSAFQISDIDGDGFPDVLESDKENQIHIKKSSIGRTNLLKEVKRPLGATFALDYKRVGNTYNLPLNIWTLSKVELFDGFKGDGADTVMNTFAYGNGIYDRNEREFYGFGNVKTNNHDTQNGNKIYRSLVEEYSNNNYYEKGLLTREIVQDADENRYAETVNTYELKDIQTGATVLGSNEDDSLFFPALAETKMMFYEGKDSPQKSTHVTYKYDVLGNVVSYTDYGDEGSEDDLTTNLTYHIIPDLYIKDVPKSMEVKSNEKTFRKRDSEIDEHTGRITQIRKQLENGSEAIFDIEYDEFGNLTKVMHPENNSGQRFFYSYKYDTEVNTYVTSIEDAYGYNSKSEYDYRFGKILLNTDINNRQIRYEIDDAGRIRTITGPFELEKGLPYTIVFDYNPDADVPWATSNHYDPQHPDNDMEIVTFIDGLERTIEIKKDATIFKDKKSQDVEQMIVSGVTIYDAFGREIENYYPVTEPKGSETEKNSAQDQISPTKKTYDVLDRVTETKDPDGTISRFEYGFGNDRDGNVQFSTKFTDGNGVTKESFKNVRQLTKSIREQYSQGSDVWTSYNYNAVNELEEVIDDQDNLIRMTYDSFGRRTEVEHPDAGLTTFDFDLADNLIKKTTANLKETGNSIQYEFDYERLNAVIYPENQQNNVVYTYGEAGADDNGAGRIVLQEDATGAQEFSYNPLGAVSKNIRTIVVPDKEALTYKTEWDYDTWGRVTEMTYPDNEVVTYDYDLGGNLSQMKGTKDGTEYNYLDRLGYNKFEKVVYKGYGNGTETFYTYFPNDFSLLETLVTKAANNRVIMDNVYTYDDADNILRIQNKANNLRNNLMGGASDYNYVYDDLYRLTKATGNYSGGNAENKYELDMEYNSIHNIIKKNQIQQFKALNKKDWNTRNKTTYNYNYDYKEEQPHAPVHIGDQAYTYDANGNQTGSTSDKSGQERQILWDEENRIQAIADNGAIFSYVYDADNQRVLKSNGGGQMIAINGSVKAGKGSIGNYTVYVNPYTVVRNSMVTNHYYVNGQRIVTKLAESNEGLLQTKAGESKNKHINYQLKQTQLQGSLAKAYSDLGIEMENWDTNTTTQTTSQSSVKENLKNGNGNANGTGNGVNSEAFVYYYHPDHLGSSAFITDANGEVTQHIEYFAFGETFLEEHSNTERTPYLYNAKELDEETELYYYGARYYDPINSNWLGVDPLVFGEYLDRQPQKGVFNTLNMAVYSYVGQNPINYTDYEGFEINPPSIYRGSGITAVMTDFFERKSGNNKPYSFDHKTNRNFWSGGPKAMKAAYNHAKKFGAITLEMTMEGQRLEKLTNIVGFDVTENAWKLLSKGYATGATGVVNVFKGLILRPDNILEKQEEPIIKRVNKKGMKTHKINNK